MSVFRSVSKSVFPSVHRATNVPAALLGGVSSASGPVLLETGDFLLLETGDKILFEG